MKIRAGFVSNSSSTSFLISAKDDFNEQAFFELMGIAQDSPVADLFQQFYHDVLNNIRIAVDFTTAESNIAAEEWFEDEGPGLSRHMITRLKDAKRRGLKAY